ncbi:flagellar hook-basal body complex protein FliE [Candidatus Riflebacteria bacterium]
MKIENKHIPINLGLARDNKFIQNTASKNMKNFTEILEKAVSEVDGLEKEAGQKSLDILLGKSKNIHEAMIAMEKARVAMNLTIEVQNKLLEAYKEINRMQV